MTKYTPKGKIKRNIRLGANIFAPTLEQGYFTHVAKFYP